VTVEVHSSPAVTRQSSEAERDWKAKWPEKNELLSERFSDWKPRTEEPEGTRQEWLQRMKQETTENPGSSMKERNFVGPEKIPSNERWTWDLEVQRMMEAGSSVSEGLACQVCSH